MREPSEVTWLAFLGLLAVLWLVASLVVVLVEWARRRPERRADVQPGGETQSMYACRACWPGRCRCEERP